MTKRTVRLARTFLRDRATRRTYIVLDLILARALDADDKTRENVPESGDRENRTH